MKLPGAGASCPVIAGQARLRHLLLRLRHRRQGTRQAWRTCAATSLCLDRATGKTLWAKEFEPVLPEHKYAGEGSYHGYAASTPITDGERLYVFFGKSGVYCFDLDGKETLARPGRQGHQRLGLGPSPMLYKDLLIVNASVESGALVALDKTTRQGSVALARHRLARGTRRSW